MTKRKEGKRKAAVKKWENTPSPNPRYKGATPAQVGHALLGKKPVCHDRKLTDDTPEIKSGV